MSERGDRDGTAKRRRNHQTRKQNGTQTAALQRPMNGDTETWTAYWEKQDQWWRREPEIDAERQQYLAERRNITPNITQGMYPFKDITLSRADIEWLLATHENGQGPVDWSDERQRKRHGLDLRGADLRGVDLNGLPLTRMLGGLTMSERADTTPREHAMASVHLEGAHLSMAHLEGAHLSMAHLEGIHLYRAHLEEASFFLAHLEGSNLRTAHLEGAFLGSAYFNGKVMDDTELEHIRQRKADFPKVLQPANLRYAYLERATILDSTNLGDKNYGFISLVDVHWGDVNLAMVNWEVLEMLGEEYNAHQRATSESKRKSRNERLREYRRATRAYRQLSIVLRNQGLNEDAARFVYRAQLMQRLVYRHQRKIWQYLFSGFLDLLAGYGYKPWRSFLAYLLVITAFATAYFIIGHTVGPVLSPLGSFVLSMTSFHGRGFFPGGIGLDDPLTVLAALEAFVGLLIEVTFIATLTQRFFAK